MTKKKFRNLNDEFLELFEIEIVRQPSGWCAYRFGILIAHSFPSKKSLIKWLRKYFGLNDKVGDNKMTREEFRHCIVCGSIIKGDYRKLPPDEKNPNWRYYHWPECGPGTEAWYRFHPSPISRLMLKGKEVMKEKRLQRRARRLGKSIEQLKEEIMKKKEKTNKKRGEHLKPMTPVIVPKSLVAKQPKEVQELLSKLSKTDRSSEEARKIRKKLRKLGFRLSDFRDISSKQQPKEKEKNKKSPTNSKAIETEEYIS